MDTNITIPWPTFNFNCRIVNYLITCHKNCTVYHVSLKVLDAASDLMDVCLWCEFAWWPKGVNVHSHDPGSKKKFYLVGWKNTSCTKVVFCKKSRLYYTASISLRSSLSTCASPLGLFSAQSGLVIVRLRGQQRVSTGYCHEKITCLGGVLYDFYSSFLPYHKKYVEYHFMNL